MKNFRLKRIHILLAGLVLSAGVVVLFFFMSAKPLLKLNADLQKQIEEQQVIAAGQAKADRDKAAAEAMAAEVKAKCAQIAKTRMPKFTYIDQKSDDIAAMIDMWTFAQRETAVMDEWFQSTGAMVSGYSFNSWAGTGLQTQSLLNQPALPAVTWNLSVTVKNYADLQRWLLTLPHAPRLLVLNSVTIPSGRAPGQPLTADVSVTLYEWAQGVSGVAAPAATGAERGGAAAGGGAAGGAGMGRGGAGGGMLRGGAGGATGRGAGMGRGRGGG